MQDKIIENVINKYKERSAKGISKYSTTLDENMTDDFLLHLQQELMDAVNYIEKLMYDKRKQNNIKKFGEEYYVKLEDLK